MKRIWQAATVTELNPGYGIMLDTKPLKKPGGAPLNVPFKPLAAAIAAEWEAAGEDGKDILPDHLPFTRLATTATDRVPHHRDTIIAQLAAYALHDLLCYRAQSPPGLVLRQSERWNPWLDWAAEHLSVRLHTAAGVTPVAQPPETEKIFAAALAQKTDYELAGLGVAIPALGSCVLGLAFAAGAIRPIAVFKLSILEDLFQAERWGDDPDAKDRREAILEDLILCEKFWLACK
jgi:chaperone required for assembly of F1-ATPase